MSETNKMVITDENGVEREVEILFTFDGTNGKRFVLFTDPQNEDAGVFAYAYDEDGNMEAVENPEELEMCEEVLGAFLDESDGGMLDANGRN